MNSNYTQDMLFLPSVYLPLSCIKRFQAFASLVHSYKEKVFDVTDLSVILLVTTSSDRKDCSYGKGIVYWKELDSG